MSYSVIIEDDERVAYAYLMKKEDIIGDIWLYNQMPSPVEVNWEDIDGMPFLNPKEYVKENIPPIASENEIKLKWMLFDNNETLKEVDIYINQKLIAKLSPESTPGWSTIVTKDGPLAKVYRPGAASEFSG